MKFKLFPRILTALISAGLLLTACEGDSTVENRDGETGTLSAPAAVQYTDDVEILNFNAPEIGEKIAVITVKDYGTIKVQLFPEAAEKGVENFIGLSEMDYYNELIFHRVIKNFMNQGGDPRGDGTGGQSMWGGEFDGGIPAGLYHFSGAIAYANSGSTSTDGSQFYIVNTDPGYTYCGGYQDADGNVQVITDLDESGISMPKNVADKYREVGGVPMLDGSYTVFGQVFEGMDVVRAIGDVATNADDKPLTQVLIEDISIVEYQG
jgi:cyclophilin family peptidyl-prolyl cis-trans isomerase